MYKTTEMETDPYTSQWGCTASDWARWHIVSDFKCPASHPPNEVL